MLAKADAYSLTSIFVSYLDLKILKRTIIVKLRYISAHKGMHGRSKCRNHRKFKFLATFTNVLAPGVRFFWAADSILCSIMQIFLHGGVNYLQPMHFSKNHKKLFSFLGQGFIG